MEKSTRRCSLLSAIPFSLVACYAQQPLTTRHESGFELKTPSSWSAESDPKTGLITVKGDHGVRLELWPVLLSGKGLDQASAAPVAESLAGKIWKETKWHSVGTSNDRIVKLSGSQNGHQLVAVLTWMPTETGAAAYFYGVDYGTKPSEADSLNKIFAKILGSFRVKSHPSAEPATASSDHESYTKFTDPKEGAFSLQVPLGWKVDGQLYRANPYSAEAVLQMTSPDGSMIVRMNDPRLTGFIEPTPMLSSTIGVGHYYSPGGVKMLVEPYLPAVQALRQYAQSILSQDVQDLQVVSEKDRPDLAAAPSNKDAVLSYKSAGEIRFNCTYNGQPYSGCLVGSTLKLKGTPALWSFGYLMGYIAQRGKESVAGEVTARSSSSIRVSPDWYAGEMRKAGRQGKILNDAEQTQRKIISEIFENQQKTTEEIGRVRENARLGLVDVVDTQFGQQYKVESGGNYYWIDNSNHVVGTRDDVAPNQNFREMISLP